MADLPVVAVEHDPAGNRIVLVAPSGAAACAVLRSAASVTVDIGTGGRLLGVESGGDYLVLDDAVDPLARSTQVDAMVGQDPDDGELLWISLPRSGPKHEITWPSGNQ